MTSSIAPLPLGQSDIRPYRGQVLVRIHTDPDMEEHATLWNTLGDAQLYFKMLKEPALDLTTEERAVCWVMGIANQCRFKDGRYVPLGITFDEALEQHNRSIEIAQQWTT